MNFTQIRENRSRIDLELRDSPLRKYFSPAMLCLYQSLVPRLRDHASGKLLDAGCGSMPFKESLADLVAEYHSLDIEKRVPEVDLVADLQDMKPVISESYDVVLCTEVLEHVAQPEKLIETSRQIYPQRPLLKPAA